MLILIFKHLSTKIPILQTPKNQKFQVTILGRGKAPDIFFLKGYKYSREKQNALLDKKNYRT